MNAYSPYALKDLYQAIDLIDRKIANGRPLETLESQRARKIHLRDLSKRRAALVNSAIVLINLGVRCNPRFHPRSFIHPVQAEDGSGIASPAPAEESQKNKNQRPGRNRS